MAVIRASRFQSEAGHCQGTRESGDFQFGSAKELFEFIEMIAKHGVDRCPFTGLNHHRHRDFLSPLLN
jgi:hypothetical protein